MILAAQYYRPPFPERRYWKEDLDGMQAAGLNAVQLWVLWGWVEPEPGVFNFDDYDELVEEARKRDLGIVLSSIGELQPYWIHRVVPDSYMIDHMGRQVISSNRGEANQGLTPGGCTDNAEVLRRMEIFLETLASRYQASDNLLGWDCWNELRWNVQSDGLVCFCPHTLSAFRYWLKNKYGDLDGLNAAWKRRYCSFEDVLPGKLPGRPYTEMMEYEAFLQWRMTQHMRFRVETIKRADPNHIVTAHGGQPSALMAGNLENHAWNRGNDWELAGPLDGLGCSHFPFWFSMSDEDFGVRVECTRSAAGNKTVWVSELQGGSARQGFTVFPSVRARPQQRWVWNGYGRGAKAVIFWCWRDEIFGRESSGYGLAGLDGLAGERIAAMQETGKIVAQFGELLEAYRPDSARVGVWVDPNTYNLEWAQDGAANRSRDGVLGYLTALERLQVPYTVVESGHLDPLKDLKVLLLPWPLVVPEAAGKAIRDFVAGGGTLLVEGEAGAYTEMGFYRLPGQERSFACALGIEDLGRRVIQQSDFDLAYGGKDYKLKAAVFTTPLKADGQGQEMIAGNSAGDVLGVQHRVGEGTVIALGTFVGMKYQEQRYEDFERFLEAVIVQGGGMPAIHVKGAGALQWRSGPAKDSRLLFITNPGSDQRVRVSVPQALFRDAPEGPAPALELHGNRELPVVQSGDRNTFEVTIAEGDYAIVKWDA